MIRQGLLRAVVTLVVAATALVAVGSPAMAATPRGPYWYVGLGSSRCIDDPNSNPSINKIQDIWTCSTVHNEEWWETDTDSGYVTIKNRSSNLCLTVQDASLDINKPILQYTCNGGANQQWFPWLIGTNGLDFYELVNRNSGLCLTVLNAHTTNGSQLIQWYCNDTGSNDLWTWYIPSGA